jgi:hypothetical protein
MWMSFETRVKVVHGKYFLPISKSVSKEFNLIPFMAGKLEATGKKQLVLSDFQPLVKLKLDLDEKTLSTAREIMQIEGYGSLDETFSAVIHRFWVKKMNLKEEHHIVYLYPEGFLQSKMELIDDYEKMMKKRAKRS